MKRIDVTQPFLPPLEEYGHYLRKIWDSQRLTNQGPFLHKFEKKLEEYLGIRKLHFVANGTLALQIAIRALDITEGEIITTPFSYVATTSAILWERCEPVFVDIEPDTFCIDPDKIEDAITDRTRAILAVHVFGNPCETEKIEKIAKKYNLRVIYDAAHAFGVTYKGRSLLGYGDASICSFHATKIFHTIEGGAIITREKVFSDKIELMKRFGHNYDSHIMLGINAKATEFQAAMGLCNLNYVDDIIEKRKHLSSLYDQALGRRFRRPILRGGTDYNFAYYPLLLNDEKHLKSTLEKLAHNHVFPRRYFYPSLNTLSYLGTSQSCPISEEIAKRIICLPLYHDLEPHVIKSICEKLVKK